MSYSIRFIEEGKEELHRLHIENQNKIKSALKNLVNNLNLGKALAGRLLGFHSLTVGNCRAIYTIDKEIILVHYVGYRKDVYSNFEQSLSKSDGS